MQCSNNPCPNQAVAKGLCKICYNHQYEYGTSRPLVKPPKQTHCSNPACGKEAKKITKGLCKSCYRYLRKFGKPRKPRVTVAGKKCFNCKKRTVYAADRCVACYSYHIRHDTERPINRELRKPHPPRKCINPACTKMCKNTSRCVACQSYFWRHKTERTKEMCQKQYYRHAKVKPTRCKVCKSPNIYSHGRCQPCQKYYQRHDGRPRPRHLWDPACPCKTCGIPLGTTSKRRRAGYCEACYSFHKRGKERPRHLWGIGPHGWCTCGRPAYHLVGDVGKCALCKDKKLSAT